MKTRSLLALCTAVVAVVAVATLSAQAPGRSPIKVVPLDPGDQSYFLLLSGPPETQSLRSGLVTLAPGKSIGQHSTEQNEEMIVPLAGEGELRVPGADPVLIRPGLITYAPTHTSHDVVNTGTVPLRYIFIVAKAE